MHGAHALLVPCFIAHFIDDRRRCVTRSPQAYDDDKQADRIAAERFGAVRRSGDVNREEALREAMMACRNSGTVSIAGVYGGFLDKIPFGAVMNRSLTIKTGQTHVQRYMPRLLEHIQNGDIDPTVVITHRLSLDDAPYGYDIFKNKQDECIKVVLKP